MYELHKLQFQKDEILWEMKTCYTNRRLVNEKIQRMLGEMKTVFDDRRRIKKTFPPSM